MTKLEYILQIKEKESVAKGLEYLLLIGRSTGSSKLGKVEIDYEYFQTCLGLSKILDGRHIFQR